jgi:hypothetical protein
MRYDWGQEWNQNLNLGGSKLSETKEQQQTQKIN